MAHCEHESSWECQYRQGFHCKVLNRPIVNRLNHSLDIIIRTGKYKEQMTSMFKSNVLFILLHLSEGPLKHGRVTHLVLDWYHDTHWY